MKDLVGQRFGRLVVQEFAGRNDKSYYWNCVCDCGNTTKTRSDGLESGHAQSCGCYNKEQLAKSNGNTKHGQARKSKAYTSWCRMKQRCYNPNSSQYRYYGGRGIKVCDRWLESFENFYEDMGDCPEGMSIDRKDSEGDYEPRNCRWATKEEQANNTRSNKWFSYENELKTLSQLGRILNIKRLTLWRRLNAYGWSEERAFSTPARVTNRT